MLFVHIVPMHTGVGDIFKGTILPHLSTSSHATSIIYTSCWLKHAQATVLCVVYASYTRVRPTDLNSGYFYLGYWLRIHWVRDALGVRLVV